MKQVRALNSMLLAVLAFWGCGDGGEIDNEARSVEIVGSEKFALAGTYWTAPDQPWGNDGTEEKPWNTWEALDKLKPGDVLLFKDGVYREIISIRSSGEPGNPITLRAADGAVPIIDQPPNHGFGGIVTGEGHVIHDVVIEGFWVQNQRVGGIGVGWHEPGSKNIVFLRELGRKEEGRNWELMNMLKKEPQEAQEVEE